MLFLYLRHTCVVAKRDEEQLCGIEPRKCGFASTDMLQALRIGVVKVKLQGVVKYYCVL